MHQTPVAASSNKNPARALVVLVAIFVAAAIALMIWQPWNASAAAPAAPVAVATALPSPPVVVTRPENLSGSNISSGPASETGSSAVTQ